MAGFGMVCRVTGGLVFTPLLHLGVEGLAAPLPLDGGLSDTPRLKSMGLMAAAS